MISLARVAASKIPVVASILDLFDRRTQVAWKDEIDGRFRLIHLILETQRKSQAAALSSRPLLALTKQIVDQALTDDNEQHFRDCAKVFQDAARAPGGAKESSGNLLRIVRDLRSEDLLVLRILWERGRTGPHVPSRVDSERIDKLVGEFLKTGNREGWAMTLDRLALRGIVLWQMRSEGYRRLTASDPDPSTHLDRPMLTDLGRDLADSLSRPLPQAKTRTANT